MKTNNKYPVYIISIGRWESRMTARAFELMGVNYRIVVEPKEFDLYASVIDRNKIITLPSNFSELKQGGIPARNFVWEHSMKEGHERHWIVDDNIGGFRMLNRNKHYKVMTPVFFKVMEDFVDRYENIAFAGPNYQNFAHAKAKIPPYYLNTRIYSCILVNNKLTYRWRGRYNEDTDICLRALKDGLCTILFNGMLQQKAATMQMKGGNTDTVYTDGDKRLKFAQSLAKQHPDYVKVVKRWGRFHHFVNYKPFKANKLRLKTNVIVQKGVNDYGLVLKSK